MEYGVRSWGSDLRFKIYDLGRRKGVSWEQGVGSKGKEEWSVFSLVAGWVFKYLHWFFVGAQLFSAGTAIESPVGFFAKPFRVLIISDFPSDEQ
jgi:hypothetical protein